MAKANDKTEQQTPETQPAGDSPERGQREQQAPSGDQGGLRERTEDFVRAKDEVREANEFAPPAGEGPRVNPDAQRRDPQA